MVLGGAAGLELVREAADGAEVSAAAQRTRPDVVLMDIRMLRAGRLTATEALMRAPDAPAVFVLTTSTADDQVRRACARAPAGPARGHPAGASSPLSMLVSPWVGMRRSCWG